MNREEVRDLADLLKLQPKIIANNRLGNGIEGDTETPEQHIPPQGYPGRDWETCMTMNDTWGFKRDDNNWKPTEKLIRNLCDIASKGGNYLLNVGPTSEGLIPQPSVERLAEVGNWMRANGEAIYGTTASPFATQLAFGRATSKSGRVYLHVFDWPADGTLRVPAWGKTVKKAYLLTNRKAALKFTQCLEGVTIQVPAKASDQIATVVVLEAER